jgi:CubicO group peptidase (beta-lactamase class C family)
MSNPQMKGFEMKNQVQEKGDRRFEALQRKLRQLMKRYQVPGVGVAVFENGQERSAGLGVTNVEHPLPVSDDTLFQIGSITKTFTALAAMQLVDEGKLALDQPVRQVLPGLKLADASVAKNVTLHHLLNHTSGWFGDYFNDFGQGDDALEKMTASLKTLPQITPLGKHFSYCNSGFYLVGRMIEAAAGKPYETVIAERIFEPLGLKDAFFFAEDVITRDFAVGHERGEKSAKIARPWSIGRAKHSAGGIVTNVKEIMRYARFWMGEGAVSDDKRLLKPETMRLMLTPQVKSNPKGSTGLSWGIRDIAGTRIINHNGGTNGQITRLMIIPGLKFAYAIFTNSETGGLLVQDIDQWILKEYLDYSDALPKAQRLSEKKLSEYTGMYSLPSADVEIRLEEGHLVLQYLPKGGFPNENVPNPPAPPPAKLVVIGEDYVMVKAGAMKGSTAEFLRDEQGQVAWLRLSGRIMARK